VGDRATIGITGDVGAGKTFVLEWLAARGAAVLDADLVVHRLLACDAGVVAAVVDRFGEDLRERGGLGIDREALASIVFDDPASLAALEAMLHPAVEREIERWLAASSGGLAVVEAVKLIESGMAGRFDQVWLVTCDPDVRRRRLRLRGWMPREIDRRMRAAAPPEPRLARADVVIDNSGTELETIRQLEPALERIQAGREGDRA